MRLERLFCEISTATHKDLIGGGSEKRIWIGLHQERTRYHCDSIDRVYFEQAERCTLAAKGNRSSWSFSQSALISNHPSKLMLPPIS